MNTIIVNYKVKKEFFETNQSNINRVIKELTNQSNNNLSYRAYVAEDGQSFTHIYQYKLDSDEELVASLSAFKTFREQLKQALIEPPVSVKFSLVAGFN